MSNVSRRQILNGMTAAGAASSGLLSASAGAQQPAAATALVSYFSSKGRLLLREPGGFLKYPSISPSLPKSQYSSELWDWDTLWTTKGLFELCRITKDIELRAKVADHAKGALANFFDHQAPSTGRIPMLITVRNPDPLHCLEGSRPNPRNQAKPVLAQLALLVADETGEAEWFRPWLQSLIEFYNSWTSDNLSQAGLLVWGNDVAIGNDNDPTTFGRPDFSSANLLLNCLYYADLCAAAELAKRLALESWEAEFSARATPLATAITEMSWDPRDKFFYTLDVQCRDRRAELIPNIARGMDMSWKAIPLRIQTFTGFLPLWCGLANADQAMALKKHALDPATFSCPSGIRSLSAQEPMYDLRFSSNPSNWLGPVWIIVNYFVWKGLWRYGFVKEAQEIASRTVGLLSRDLANSGSLNEYYHPDSGKPISHAGFMDWNLLVLEMIGTA